MTISTLDPRSALILVDLQVGVVALAAKNCARAAVSKACDLAAAFRLLRLPVVLVNVDGRPPGRTEQPPALTSPPDGWMNLVDELRPQPDDIRITKHSWGAFTGTGLEDILRRRSVTQLVIAGISTSIGVETTARQAFERGFNVALALDAMCDANIEAQANTMARIFPRLGETGSVQEILERLPAVEV